MGNSTSSTYQQRQQLIIDLLSKETSDIKVRPSNYDTKIHILDARYVVTVPSETIKTIEEDYMIDLQKELDTEKKDAITIYINSMYKTVIKAETNSLLTMPVIAHLKDIISVDALKVHATNSVKHHKIGTYLNAHDFVDLYPCVAVSKHSPDVFVSWRIKQSDPEGCVGYWEMRTDT